MGHVDNLHDPKDEGQAQAVQGVIAAFQEAGEDGLKDSGAGDQGFGPLSIMLIKSIS